MRIYTPQFPSVACADFTYAGKLFKVGEPFPHAALKLNDVQIRGLWAANLISFVVPTSSAAPTQAAAQAPIVTSAKPQPNRR